MSVRGKALIQQIEQWAPPRLALPKDRIGLQIGSPEASVEGVLVTLDVTEAVVDEAIRVEANWIIAHHAVIFQPLAVIDTASPKGRMIAKCLTNGINIYIAHTNLDTAIGGVNDVLAERLGLRATEPLDIHYRERLLKLVVTIPIDHHKQVLTAITSAGAGWIGNYSDCTFNLRGTGTFRPQSGTTPYIGTAGDLTEVEEIRLETILPAERRERVLAALIANHPYEEIAYDLYPLEQTGAASGLGRIGNLPNPLRLAQLAEQVKEAYQVPALRMVGDQQREVKRVAVLGGSGGRYWSKAWQRGADVLITGDLDFHTAQEAWVTGLALLDPGHHVERWAMEPLRLNIQQAFSTVPTYTSTVNTNPFQFV